MLTVFLRKGLGTTPGGMLLAVDIDLEADRGRRVLFEGGGGERADLREVGGFFRHGFLGGSGHVGRVIGCLGWELM